MYPIRNYIKDNRWTLIDTISYTILNSISLGSLFNWHLANSNVIDYNKLCDKFYACYYK